MKTKLFQYYEGLPSWAKGVTVVGGLAILYLTGNYIVRSIRQKKEEALYLAEADAASRRIQELQNSGITPTFPDSAYQGWANQILAAITDCGTDEDTIYRIFENMKNEADLQKLITAFGVREFKGCFSAYFAKEKGSLSYALNYELSNSELSKVNNILKSKNINYRF